METTMNQCTCEGSEYNDGNKWDRHTSECTLSPDTTGWLYYPHSSRERRVRADPNPTERTICQ
jgi:hypothetical protein